MFRAETDLIRNRTNSEFENIETRNFEGDILNGVRDNIEKISTNSDDIIKNMLAMILKIEADKEQQK